MSTPNETPKATVALRMLGNTGVQVSEVALGTWGIGANAYGPVNTAQFEDTVRAAWDAGITTFDVSPSWGDGIAEKRLGLALGEDLHKAVLVLRAGQVMSEGRLQGQFDGGSLIRSVESSLTRLGREQIDVLLLHNPPAKVIVSDFFWKGTSHLKTTGVVKTWGMAVGSLDDARLAIEHGAEVLCLTHNLLYRSDLAALSSLIADHGTGVFTRSPLLYGVLTGRFSAETVFPENDHRHRRWYRDAWKRRIDEVESFRSLVEGDVPDMTSLALRFVLSNEQVGAMFVGARTADQVRSAVGSVAKGAPYLSTEQLGRIAALG
jgi:aryl-alcohol dehydrogenase-like predicted oxidoreductase